jgi:hypothetical protein
MFLTCSLKKNLGVFTLICHGKAVLYSSKAGQRKDEIYYCATLVAILRHWYEDIKAV